MAQPSSSQKQAGREKKQEDFGTPLISLVTFEPVGNPLENMPEPQRQHFIHSLQQVSRPRTQYPQDNSLSLTPTPLARSAIKPILQQKPCRETALPAQAGVKKASECLAREVGEFARGDAAKAAIALEEFRSRLQSQGFKSDDLMAVLLLVIEDIIWAGGGEKPLDRGAPAHPSGQLVPEMVRQSAMDSATVRLASVREMLRYYFDSHPRDYRVVLSAALGIAADQEGDEIYLQERLAYALSSIGSFALAQKILAELKRKKKMDARKCLLELGYFYDSKAKRLIIGKRTCTGAAEAKRIIALLLAAARDTRMSKK